MLLVIVALGVVAAKRLRAPETTQLTGPGQIRSGPKRLTRGSAAARPPGVGAAVPRRQ